MKILGKLLLESNNGILHTTPFVLTCFISSLKREDTSPVIRKDNSSDSLIKWKYHEKKIILPLIRLKVKERRSIEQEAGRVFLLSFYFKTIEYKISWNLLLARIICVARSFKGKKDGEESHHNKQVVVSVSVCSNSTCRYWYGCVE